jgi:hypothetical protein
VAARHRARPARRAWLLGLCVVVATAGACSAPGAEPTAASATGEASPPPEELTVPAFNLEGPGRSVVATAPGRIPRRILKASYAAAARARSLLTALYVEAFLDPANWETADYDEAFTGFAGPARREAESRTTLLTAGSRAGERYEAILPTKGLIRTKILLDRRGVPTLIVSVVRFAAVASGPEPVTIRSTGQYFLERVGGTWRIVSFHVRRTDSPGEAA